jgi:hypothetical protein
VCVCVKWREGIVNCLERNILRGIFGPARERESGRERERKREGDMLLKYNEEI